MTPAERAFVERARVGAFATVDEEGRPHVVPICYALLDVDGSPSAVRVVSAIDEKPKATRELTRVRNVRANPRVTLLIDRYREDWSRLAWVQLRGRARLLEPDAPDGARSEDPTRPRSDSTLHEAAVDALEGRYDQYAAHDLGDRPIVSIRVDRTVSWGPLEADGGRTR